MEGRRVGEVGRHGAWACGKGVRRRGCGGGLAAGGTGAAVWARSFLYPTPASLASVFQRQHDRRRQLAWQGRGQRLHRKRRCKHMTDIQTMVSSVRSRSVGRPPFGRFHTSDSANIHPSLILTCAIDRRSATGPAIGVSCLYRRARAKLQHIQRSPIFLFWPSIERNGDCHRFSSALAQEGRSPRSPSSHDGLDRPLLKETLGVYTMLVT